MPKIASASASRRKRSSPIKHKLEHDEHPESSSPQSCRQEAAVQEQDKSLWRESWISEHSDINKTAAVADYHLNVKDLEGLPFKKSQTSVKINGVDKIRPMYLYKERDVEMKAWRKYGGPEGFQKMLNDKAARFYAKHEAQSGKIFPKPHTYLIPNDPTLAPCVRPGIFTWPEHHPDAETCTPALIQIKQQMEERGEKWLWDSLNKILRRISQNSDCGLTKAERESMMQCALEMLTLKEYYPKRSASLPPVDSASFKALNEVLAEAPSGEDGDNTPGVVVHEDAFTGDVDVDWEHEYKEKVHDCLVKVLEEHGDDGLEKARWIVYDKYVECNMKGSWFNRSDSWCKWYEVRKYEYEWTDNATFWLTEPIDRWQLGGAVVPRA